MPDHVHLLLYPLKVRDGEWIDLSDILKGLKGTSSRDANKVLGRRGSLWQAEGYNRIIRNRGEFRETRRYIYRNPREAGLVERAGDYPFLMFPGQSTINRQLA